MPTPPPDSPAWSSPLPKVPGVATPPALALAIFIGSMGWVLIASRTGLPVSTTHALTGALVGAGWIALGGQGLIWSALFGKIALLLLLSPILALTLSVRVHPLIRSLASRWEGTCLCLMSGYRALVTVDIHSATRTLFQAAGFGPPVMDVPAHCDRAGLRGLTIGLDSMHWISQRTGVVGWGDE